METTVAKQCKMVFDSVQNDIDALQAARAKWKADDLIRQ